MKFLISFFLRHIPRKYLQRFSHWGLQVLRVFYIGRKVQCPVCLARFRKFLPYGRKSRSNALCPNCLALERHRLIWLYLQRRTDFFSKPARMLHIAPELCFIHRFEKLTHLDYITADIESPLAKVKMDIHQIPFEDNSFDIIFCNHVLEHVQDDLLAMREMYRVMKPGGWAILQVPFFPPLPEITEEDTTITDPRERERRFGQDDHVRKYGLDYALRLSRAGFQVTEDRLVMELEKDEVEKYGLPKNETIYLGQKHLTD
jgi:SAM-dependent methyltransferase